METLVDRYLAAVNDILPAKQRKDTVTEIRSLIQDALDERSKAEGREPDDEMMAAVLLQFGSPQKIAAPYLPERYLIGPRLFPTFLLVLRIALPIIGILSLVSFWIGYNSAVPFSGVDLVSNIARSLGTALTTVVQAFGNIVFIFAIIQWVYPEFKLTGKEKEWDPHTLKAISRPNKVKRGDLILEIFFTLVGLIIFTFYLDQIGIYNYVNGQWIRTALLTPAFNAYVPVLDLLWVLTILLDVYLLRKGSWQTVTRIFSVILNAFNIGIAASLISHIQSLYTLQGVINQIGSMETVQTLLNQLLILVLSLAILASLVKIGQMTWRLVKASPAID